MTINSTLLTGVSGLLAQSTALAAISNNIANANTVGYKTENTAFSDMVTGSSIMGDTGSGGVMAQDQQAVTVQGQLTQTSSNTDLGIQGQGFFVTSDSADPTVTDPRNFTRAGSFTVDANGNLVNAAGGYLQGWPATANGQITPSESSVASLQTINVAGANGGGAVSPTANASISANLNSQQTVDTDATGYSESAATPGAGQMALYAQSGGTKGIKPDFTISVPVSDSQGGEHTLSLDVVKTGANTWAAELVAPQGSVSDTQGGAANATGLIASGALAFNSDGSINLGASSLQDASGNTINLSSGTAAVNLNWTSATGVSTSNAGAPISQSINLGLSGLTQIASDSVTSAVDTDGTQFGNLTSVTVDSQGFVTAAYDNGVTRKIAQVAVATFQNPDGLTSVSGDNYQVSSASGTYSLKEPGTGNAGKISPSTLEASTVDLSQQFAGLIVTQQAYAASTKILTTADQMLQQLISIKQ
jgi:flagellar hook protein FlgE